MTSQASARCSKHRGFTLTELLVVIGILVLIAGFLLPMLVRSYKQAGRTRTAADLQTIAAGLEAYKQDWGDYPPIPVPGTAGEPSHAGFAILTKALVGPGYANTTFDGSGGYGDKTSASTAFFLGDIEVSGSTEYLCIRETGTAPPGSLLEWQPFPTRDGAGSDNTKNGGTPAPDASDNGFRIRRSPAPSTDQQGRIHGPYIAVDKFKVRGMAMLDREERVILYYRPTAVKPDLTQVNRFVSNAILPAAPYYHTWQNPIGIFGDDPATAGDESLPRLRAMFGDYNRDGKLDPAAGESEPQVSGYILWSPGSDGVYGSVDITATSTPAEDKNTVAKCDDVLNFTR